MAKTITISIPALDDKYWHVENPCSRWICNWIDRMSAKFGGHVYDKRRPLSGTAAHFGWDWGQAICAAQFGTGWSKHLTDHQIVDADEESVRIAKEWEAGEWPEWAWCESRPDNRPNDTESDDV